MGLAHQQQGTDSRDRAERWRRMGRIVGGVAFAMTPWVSFGLATAIAFILAAALFGYLGKLHAVVLWTSAAIYTAVTVVEFAVAAGCGFTPGSDEEYIFFACLFVTFVVGGLQAIAAAVLAAVHGFRPAVARTTRDARRKAAAHVRGVGYLASLWPRTRPPVVPKLDHPRMVVAVTGVAALAILVTGVALTVKARDFAAHQQAADGAIAAVGEGHSGCSGCSVSYRTTIRYQPHPGEVMEFSVGMDDRSAIGSHLAVYDDLRDPRDARIDPGSDERDAGGLIIVAGLATLLFSASASPATGGTTWPATPPAAVAEALITEPSASGEPGGRDRHAERDGPDSACCSDAQACGQRRR